jgi:hypothetical protein
MSETIKKKFTEMSKDVLNRLDVLETQLTYVKTGLQKLLDEDDIKELPSYGLLQSIYSEYLTNLPKVVSTKETVLDDQYDPLYSPIKSRHRVNAASRRKFEASKGSEVTSKVTVQTKDDESHYSEMMPDFGADLLTDMSKSKSNPKSNPKPKPNPKPNPSTNPTSSTPSRQSNPTPKLEHNQITITAQGTVYSVEINGKQYYRYDKYLYDTETLLRIGSVEDTCFAIVGKSPILITNRVNLTSVENGMYKGNNTVYVQVNDNIFQAIGEIKDDAIGLW